MLGESVFLILIHMARGGGTHALPLTSGMILAQNWPIRVLSYLPGLADYGVKCIVPAKPIRTLSETIARVIENDN